MLEEEERTVIDTLRARSEPALKTEGFPFIFDVALLLFLLHAKRRVGKHVIESPFISLRVAIEAVFGERVP